MHPVEVLLYGNPGAFYVNGFWQDNSDSTIHYWKMANTGYIGYVTKLAEQDYIACIRKYHMYQKLIPFAVITKNKEFLEEMRRITGMVDDLYETYVDHVVSISKLYI